MPDHDRHQAGSAHVAPPHAGFPLVPGNSRHAFTMYSRARPRISTFSDIRDSAQPSSTVARIVVWKQAGAMHIMWSSVCNAARSAAKYSMTMVVSV